jgi:hypothetical protein
MTKLYFVYNYEYLICSDSPSVLGTLTDSGYGFEFGQLPHIVRNVPIYGSRVDFEDYSVIVLTDNENDFIDEYGGDPDYDGDDSELMDLVFEHINA